MVGDIIADSRASSPGIRNSAIFPTNPEQTRVAEAYIPSSASHVFDAAIVTRIEPGRDFYPPKIIIRIS